MPIVEVAVVGDEPFPDGLAALLARDLAAAFGGPAAGTWVALRRIPSAHYGEGDGGPPQGVRPVFVSITRADPPAGVSMAAEVAKIVDVVAAACDITVDNVHVVYEPAARGRIAFGGEVVS